MTPLSPRHGASSAGESGVKPPHSKTLREQAKTFVHGLAFAWSLVFLKLIMADYRILHPWDLTPPEAVALQQTLRAQVRLEPPGQPIRTVAGADISFNKFEETIYAGIVVLRLPGLEVIEQAGVVTSTRFPYVPGLLSFREAPAVLEAWEQLQTTPDAVMFDGQGIAHPRRLGIAAHVGLWLDRPTFGCAKSVLSGRYEEPATARGARSPLVDRGETVGAALRTKDGTQPIFVSAGHRMDLETAVALTLACDGSYRQPEPTRRAHLLVNALRRGETPPGRTGPPPAAQETWF